MGYKKPPLSRSHDGNHWEKRWQEREEIHGGAITLRPEMPFGIEERLGQRETCGAAGYASKGLVQVSPKNLDFPLCHLQLSIWASPVQGSPL